MPPLQSTLLLLKGRERNAMRITVILLALALAACLPSRAVEPDSKAIAEYLKSLPSASKPALDEATRIGRFMGATIGIPR
jgi:hypothetical protein